MLRVEIQNLIDQIKIQQADDVLEFEKLEAASSLLIAVDDFHALPEYVKDEIYLIDMHEIENLNSDRLMKVITILQKYLSSED